MAMNPVETLVRMAFTQRARSLGARYNVDAWNVEQPQVQFRTSYVIHDV